MTVSLGVEKLLLIKKRYVCFNTCNSFFVNTSFIKAKIQSETVQQSAEGGFGKIS